MPRQPRVNRLVACGPASAPFRLNLWRKGHVIPVWRTGRLAVDGRSRPDLDVNTHAGRRAPGSFDKRSRMERVSKSVVRGTAVLVLAMGLVATGCASRNRPDPTVTGQTLGVNGYLWRASLDTLAFMPLASADPYGGVIITDWYSNPEKPDERFKATVYILDTRLRADGLTVTVFKQVKGADGQWVESTTSVQTQVDIENSILTRARQLRLSNIR